MNKADLWAGNLAPLSNSGNTEERGMDTLRLINSRPCTIVISRDVVDLTAPSGTRTIQLPPQTVWLDVIQSIRNASEKADAVMSSSDQYVVIVGVKDNPFMPNTDMIRNDQFFYQNLMWEVVEFLPTVPGRLLASGDLRP